MRLIIGHSEYCRAARAAFLSPWFAVSLGVVVAAALSLAMPSTALTFPPSKAGRCLPAGCANAKHGAAPSQSPRNQGNLLRLRSLPASQLESGPAVPGIALAYGLLPHSGHHRFMAMIAITNSKPLGKWALRFVLPDARIKEVMWANWATTHSGEIIVTGSPSPWPRSSPDQARIVIQGTGTPKWPEDCRYNTSPCTFTPLPKPPS